MAFRRSGSSRVSGPRRLTNWGSGPGGSGVASVSAGSSVILGSGIQFGSAGTVVRIRGIFDMFLTAATASGDGFFGAVGIGLASLAAFTAGIGSLPTPLQESIWDGWLWHSFISVHRDVTTGDSGSSSQRFSIDSKAMRKVSDEMVIYAAVDVVEIGTAVASIFLDSRMLIKEG